MSPPPVSKRVFSFIKRCPQGRYVITQGVEITSCETIINHYHYHFHYPWNVANGYVVQASGSLLLCAGQNAGSEAATHAMNTVFEADDTDEVLLIDASNAFNALNIHYHYHYHYHFHYYYYQLSFTSCYDRS